MTVAQAAVLAAEAARLRAGQSGEDSEAIGELSLACERLRELGGVLAAADEAAHEDLRSALELPDAPGVPARSDALSEVGSAVVDVPVQTAEAGAEVARIAAALLLSARRGTEATAAAAAVLLASAAATTAALMVVEGLPRHPDGPGSPVAEESARAAWAAAEGATALVHHVEACLPWPPTR